MPIVVIFFWIILLKEDHAIAFGIFLEEAAVNPLLKQNDPLFNGSFCVL